MHTVVYSFFKRHSLLVSLLFSIIFLLTMGVAKTWAKRTVKGTVIEEANNFPVEGALVRAFDSDPGADDFMGESVTDENGYYEIHYRDGHWDPAPHAITTWRPDIHVRVFIKAGDRWARVYTSPTKDNQRLRDDLVINCTVKAPARIYGTITGSDYGGSPLSGVYVGAWDEDLRPDSDDFMGNAITDSQGRYEILYHRKHWDSYPHASGLWRPDIIVEAYKDGYEARSSGTHENHPLKEDLRWDVCLGRLPEPEQPSSPEQPGGEQPARTGRVTLRLKDGGYYITQRINLRVYWKGRLTGSQRGTEGKTTFELSKRYPDLMPDIHGNVYVWEFFPDLRPGRWEFLVQVFLDPPIGCDQDISAGTSKTLKFTRGRLGCNVGWQEYP